MPNRWALPDDPEADLAAGKDDSHDPVRTYLREMGKVRLLTRDGEVVLAKRIEKGEWIALKALSRSPFLVQELLAIAADLRSGGRRSINKAWCRSIAK